MSDFMLLILNIVILCVFQLYVVIQYARKNKRQKSIFYLGAMFLFLFLLIYEYHLNLSIPSFVIPCSLIALVVGHIFLGGYLDFYHKSKYYDRYLHLFGVFSFALLFFSILHATIKPVLTSHLYIFALVFTLGMTIGAFFEISEFIQDSRSPKNLRQHGLRDTNFDLVFDAFGSLLAACLSLSIF